MNDKTTGNDDVPVKRNRPTIYDDNILYVILKQAGQHRTLVYF